MKQKIAAIDHTESDAWKPFNSHHHGYIKLSVEIDQSSIQVLELKRPGITLNSPCVVFVHGLGSSWDVWEDVYNFVLPHCRLFAVELPWSGKSHPSWSWSRESTAWLHEALTRIPCRLDAIVAHSFGAQVVLKYLSENSVGTLASAVLLSTPFKSADEINWKGMQATIDALQLILEEGIRVKQSLKRVLADDIVSEMAAKLKERIGPQAWLQFYYLLAGMNHINFDGLTIPVQLLCGNDESTVSLEDCCKLQAKIPNCHMGVIEDCKHFAMIEKPSEFAGLVNRFLLEQTPFRV